MQKAGGTMIVDRQRDARPPELELSRASVRRRLYLHRARTIRCGWCFRAMGRTRYSFSRCTLGIRPLLQPSRMSHHHRTWRCG
jgi:hypothetical protein